MAEGQSAQELLEPVRDLLERGEATMAFERLNFLVHTHAFAEDEQWIVYDHYATCYYKLFDLENWRKYAWACLTATKGQPRRRQQENYSDYIFMLHYFPDVSDEAMRQAHFRYQEFTDAMEKFEHPLARHQHAKLRIGYLAAEMAENVVSLFSIQLLTAFDPRRFEVYAYSLRPVEDRLTDLLRSYVKKLVFFPAGTTPQERARMIYEDEIDVLFDLDVHASGGRTLLVSGTKPAPVQACGIGYMSTSGTDVFDAFLGDRFCDPPGLHDEDFAEKTILRLPSHLCYTPSERVLRCRPTAYVPHDPIVFGSFNNFFKITDEMLAAWREILRRVPGSRMIIKNSSRKTNAMKVTRRRVLAAGIPEDAFTLEDATGDYLARYADVDIMLDTYPYTGGGTTCESLYMGVPVVARYGRRHGARFSYSILQNVGIGELACRATEEYIEKAVALASDKALLTALHAQLPTMLQRSPVMAANAYVRTVEACYEKLFAAWRARKKEGN